MAKETRLSEFEQGEITTLKRVGKYQKEILQALGRSKTITCNCLKSPNKYRTRKLTARQKTIITTIREKNCSRSKKENSSISKILKSLVDALRCTRTMRNHFNNKKSKQKKKKLSSKVNYEAQKETTGICSSISNQKC